MVSALWRMKVLISSSLRTAAPGISSGPRKRSKAGVAKTARPRPELADMRHEAVAVGLSAGVVEHQGGDEMELQVGRIEFRAAFEEGAGFQRLSVAGPLPNSVYCSPALSRGSS